MNPVSFDANRTRTVWHWGSLHKKLEWCSQSAGSGRQEQRGAGLAIPVVVNNDHGSPLLALGQLDGAMLAQRRMYSERAGLRVELDSGQGAQGMRTESIAQG